MFKRRRSPGVVAGGPIVAVLLAAFASREELHWRIVPHAAAQSATARPTAPTASAGNEAGSGGGQKWNELPTMLLEKMYRGPLRDTVIQRWRDPIDGTVCFVYIPISAPLLPPSPEGYVQYRPNQIGSVSCTHPTQVLQLWQGAAPPPCLDRAVRITRRNGSLDGRRSATTGAPARCWRHTAVRTIEGGRWLRG